MPREKKTEMDIKRGMQTVPVGSKEGGKKNKLEAFFRIKKVVAKIPYVTNAL